MTGPDQANIGAARRVAGAATEGGAEGTADADVALARMLMLMLMLMLGRARFWWCCWCWVIYLRCVLYAATAVEVTRQVAGQAVPQPRVWKKRVKCSRK